VTDVEGGLADSGVDPSDAALLAGLLVVSILFWL
jgi:hypothetical protein